MFFYIFKIEFNGIKNIFKIKDYFSNKKLIFFLIRMGRYYEINN